MTDEVYIKEKPYSKREIDMITKPILDHLDEQDKTFVNVNKTLARIEIQTTKTNGRVNKHTIWFKVIWGALGVLGTLLIFGIPIFMNIEKYYIRTSIKDAVEASLNARVQSVQQ